LTLRYITQADLEQLEDLDKKCFPREIRYNRYALGYYVSLKDSIGIIKSIDENIVGFIITTITSNGFANIVTIDIAPEFRRRGFGSNLISAVKLILQELDIKKISLQVSVNNESAIEFYLKHGFEIISILPSYYPGSDGYQMDCII